MAHDINQFRIYSSRFDDGVLRCLGALLRESLIVRGVADAIGVAVDSYLRAGRDSSIIFAPDAINLGRYISYRALCLRGEVGSVKAEFYVGLGFWSGTAGVSTREPFLGVRRCVAVILLIGGKVFVGALIGVFLVALFGLFVGVRNARLSSSASLQCFLECRSFVTFELAVLVEIELFLQLLFQFLAVLLFGPFVK